MNRQKRQRASKLRAQRVGRPAIMRRRQSIRELFAFLRDGMYEMAGVGPSWRHAPMVVSFNEIPMTRTAYNASVLANATVTKVTPSPDGVGAIVTFTTRGRRQWVDPAPRWVRPLPVALPLELHAELNAITAEINAINARMPDLYAWQAEGSTR